MKSLEHLGCPGPSIDVLGPVSVASLPDEPEYQDVSDYRFITWDARASTTEARDLCEHLARLLGAVAADDPKKPGAKPKRSPSEVLEALVGDLMLHGASGLWSAQGMTPSVFSDLPVGAVVVRRVVRVLEYRGYVKVVPGYRPEGAGTGLTTKLRGTKALFILADLMGIPWRQARAHFTRREDRVRKTRPPLAIRPLDASKRPKGAKTLPIPKTPEARTLAAEVEAFNAFVAGFQIQSGRPDNPTIHEPVFQRVFRERLGLHGRLYDCGASYQHLRGWKHQDQLDSRATMTINGEPVAELDIHASWLTLVHGLAGVPLPDKPDLFDFPGLKRDAVKLWHNAFINNGAKNLGNWPSDTPKDIRNQSRKEIRSSLLGAYPFLGSVRTLLGVPEDQPKLCGEVLTAMEARAILGAVFELMDRGILALPVHDSLVVQARNIEAARETMTRHYRETAGVAPIIRVRVAPGGLS